MNGKHYLIIIMLCQAFLQKAEQSFSLYNGMMQKEKLEYINANTEHLQIKRHDLCFFCVP